jgi:hypothetical protein
MSAEFHPIWCAREACTAYDPDIDIEGRHRSTAIVIDTDDPAVGLHVYRSADPDGITQQRIELAKLDLSDGGPWHLADPVPGEELCIPPLSAEPLCRAVAWLAGITGYNVHLGPPVDLPPGLYPTDPQGHTILVGQATCCGDVRALVVNDRRSAVTIGGVEVRDPDVLDQLAGRLQANARSLRHQLEHPYRPGVPGADGCADCAAPSPTS